MRKHRPGSAIYLALCCAVVFGPAHARAEEPASADPAVQSPDHSLVDGFKDPPLSARPRVWWHWMNGNITKDGIAKDLDWLAATGIGGVQNFDASLQTPQVVGKRLVYMEPDWQDAFRFAVNEANRHGLEFAIAASPGWSVTGGPWVKPEDGMKKLVWSETRLKGGKRFVGKLPALPETTGPYQDLPFSEVIPGQGGGESVKPKGAGSIAVLAVPAGLTGFPLPSLSLGDGARLPASSIADPSLVTAVTVPLSSEKSAMVNLAYANEVTVRSLRVFIPGLKLPFRGVPLTAVLERQEGREWRKVADVPLGAVPTTQSFPPATARNFRLRLMENPDKGNLDLLNAAPGAISINFFDTGDLKQVELADLQLFPEPMVDHAAEKAGYEAVPDYYAIASQERTPSMVSASDVVDLTDRVSPDGTLSWTPPNGQDWRIVRFGWSLTGKTNHPATPEATGLEVDKYDGAAVRRYLETYLSKYETALNGTEGLRALLTDSIEVGAANWTGAMEAEFQQRRGYALRPWLPALTGTVVGSAAQTEGFLYDYRRTLAELLADKHYGTVAAVAHERGLKVYGEALEDKRPMLGDDLAMRSHADVPMAALWTFSSPANLRTTLVGDMRGAASVAHVYGRPLVAAESMTSVNAPWDFAPRDLKPVIDLEFASGINRPIIHTSVHQPLDDMQPGLSLAIFGQYFNRHESWAPLARPWIDYIARSSYLLQQGRNVADVAWFIGEEAPVTALFAEKVPPNLPTSHAYDFVNAQMLSDALDVDAGEIVSKGGARYKAIYLGGTSQQMTLPTLRRLADLVRGGATLIGKRPLASPSLADDSATFTSLAERLWGGETGKGRVIASSNLDAGLAEAGVPPAFQVEGASSSAKIAFVERAFSGGRLFFLSNQGDASEQFTARLRSAGKRPELWDAVSGTGKPIAYRIEGGETRVQLTMAPHDAIFVMLREDTALVREDRKALTVARAGEVEGPWTVTFQPKRGAPGQISMAALSPLHLNVDPAIRYFSGIATYASKLSAPSGWKPGKPLWLDLGRADDVAEVWLNGKRIGGLWRAPYRIDIGPAARRGTNTLEVKVANKWVNRLIGDAQPGAVKIAKIAVPGYLPDAPLRPSGLAGPVTLWTEPR